MYMERVQGKSQKQKNVSQKKPSQNITEKLFALYSKKNVC